MTEFIDNFTLLRPWYLLAVLPVIAIWFALGKGQDISERYKGFIAPHLLKHLLVGPARQSIVRPSHLLFLLWILLIIALSGPSWQWEPSPFAEEQAGLMVLLKVSPSMKAEDLKPSRLDRARHKMRDLFKTRPGGSVGLIAYSGSAHLVMPLTRDSRIIEQMAQELDPLVMPVEGDALGEALFLAKNQFERSKIAGSILVITDGIDSAQMSRLEAYKNISGPPVQILATVASKNAAGQAGIDRAASFLKAPVQIVTVNDSDVRQVASRTESLVSAVAAEKQGSRRKDHGYAFVPVCILGLLLWARKGWSVRWG